MIGSPHPPADRAAGRSIPLEIRPLCPDDEPAALRLLAVSMGWAGDGRDAAYFHWKHHQSPFGTSPGWVAVDDGEVIGLRVFMRWAFTDGERTFRAVRAVDTATHPAHRGRGVFTRLTTHALARLRDEGVDFVFNTPNAQSKPGYLAMGWEEVGRLPVAVKLRSPLALARVARSRVAAERDPVPTDVGEPALDALEAAGDLEALGASTGAEAGGALATPRTAAFLRWRYGHEPLGYRGWRPPGGGLVLFRLRRRGQATELVVNDLLLPPGAERTRTVGRLVRLVGADHAVRIAEPGSVEARLAPPGLGPVLTWRGLVVTERPPLDRWALAMGDVELF